MCSHWMHVYPVFLELLVDIQLSPPVVVGKEVLEIISVVVIVLIVVQDFPRHTKLSVLTHFRSKLPPPPPPQEKKLEVCPP